MAQSFNADEPLAFLITWTVYGSWLPGDPRGWRERGQPGLQPPNELFYELSAARMKETEFWLSHPDRDVVENSVRQHCRIRNWELHAINPRSNHVHVVVKSPGSD